MKRLLAVAAVVGLVVAVSAQSAKAEKPSVGMMVYTFTKTTSLYGGLGLVLDTSGVAGDNNINSTYGAWFTAPGTDYTGQTGITGKAIAVDDQEFQNAPVSALKVGAIAGFKGDTTAYTFNYDLAPPYKVNIVDRYSPGSAWWDHQTASITLDTWSDLTVPWSIGIKDGKVPFDWTMVEELNSDGMDHAKVYQYDTQATGLDGHLWNVSDFYVGFEDLAKGAADVDYNDNLIFVRAYTSEVPEPAFVQLAGLLGLAGLGLLRVRRSHRA